MSPPRGRRKREANPEDFCNRRAGQAVGVPGCVHPAFRELAQGTDASMGQGLLSRLPVRSVRSIQFHAQTGFWQPRPWIPNWPLMQRRTGGRAAQVAELEAGGTRLIVYNLHLESRSARARMAQLEETLGDAGQYGSDVAVVIAGDLNTQFGATAYLRAVRSDGFRNCFGEQSPRTHHLVGKVDWIFVRGPVECSDIEVHPEAPGSDHFPITAVLTLRSPTGVVPFPVSSEGADADVRRSRSQSQ